MPGKTDIPDLPRLLCSDRSFKRPVRPEDPVRIFQPDALVELHQVDHIRLQPPQGLFQLFAVLVLSPPVDLGHQERLLPVPVLQRLAHPYLGDAVVVIPAVIQERDAAVYCGSNQPDALSRVFLLPNVKAAQPDGGNGLTRRSQLPVHHIRRLRSARRRPFAACLGRCRLAARTRRDRGSRSRRRPQKLSSLHITPPPRWMRIPPHPSYAPHVIVK